MSCLLGTVSCGGTTSEAQSPEKDGASASADEKEVEELPPLEPATAPDGVVFKARIKSAGKLVDGVLAHAAVPIDWRKEVFDDLGSELEAAIEIDGPIEGVVVAHPIVGRAPLAAYSLSAKGVRPVLGALDEMRVDVREGPSQLHYFELDGQECAVGRALGPSPARVVCADDEASLHELHAYALRGLPTEELSDADVFFEFVAEPLQVTYDKHLRSMKLLASAGARQFYLDNPKFDNAFSDALIGLAGEAGHLAREVESLRGELWQKKGTYRMVATATFEGEQSWTVRALQDLGKVQGPAPKSFGRIPSTASAAAFAYPLPSERVEGILEILASVTGGFGEARGLSPATVSRLEKLVKASGNLDAPKVSGSGPIVTVKKGDGTTLVPAWSLWGTGEKLQKVKAFVDDLAYVLSARDLAKLLEFEPPTLKRKQTALRGVPGALVYEWTVPDEFYEFFDRGGISDSEMDRMRGLRTGYIALVETDGETWVSSGQELESVAEPLRALASKDTQRLSDVNEIAHLRKAPAAGAGFAKLDGLVGPMAPFMPSKVAKQWASMLRATPNRGQVPLEYRYEVERSDKTVFRVSETIPDELVADVVAMVVMLAIDD